MGGRMEGRRSKTLKLLWRNVGGDGCGGLLALYTRYSISGTECVI
jgi:hypothetical protein